MLRLRRDLLSRRRRAIYRRAVGTRRAFRDRELPHSDSEELPAATAVAATAGAGETGSGGGAFGFGASAFGDTALGASALGASAWSSGNRRTTGLLFPTSRRHHLSPRSFYRRRAWRGWRCRRRRLSFCFCRRFRRARFFSTSGGHHFGDRHAGLRRGGRLSRFSFWRGGLGGCWFRYGFRIGFGCRLGGLLGAFAGDFVFFD